MLALLSFLKNRTFTAEATPFSDLCRILSEAPKGSVLCLAYSSFAQTISVKFQRTLERMLIMLPPELLKRSGSCSREPLEALVHRLESADHQGDAGTLFDSASGRRFRTIRNTQIPCWSPHNLKFLGKKGTVFSDHQQMVSESASHVLNICSCRRFLGLLWHLYSRFHRTW